jgi:hypothetical protein
VPCTLPVAYNWANLLVRLMRVRVCVGACVRACWIVPNLLERMLLKVRVFH